MRSAAVSSLLNTHCWISCNSLHALWSCCTPLLSTPAFTGHMESFPCSPCLCQGTHQLQSQTMEAKKTFEAIHGPRRTFLLCADDAQLIHWCWTSPWMLCSVTSCVVNNKKVLQSGQWHGSEILHGRCEGREQSLGFSEEFEEGTSYLWELIVFSRRWSLREDMAKFLD